MNELKNIIKETLDNSIEPRRIVGMSHVEQQDFKRWQRIGLRPFVINDDAKYGISFEEIDYNDLKPLIRRQGERQAIYLLEPEQVKVAQRFAEPIMQMINLKRKGIETLKELFAATLTQKFMKNDFGKMQDHDDSDDKIQSRNEAVAKARQLLRTLEGTLSPTSEYGGKNDATAKALEAIETSGLDWESLPSSLRDKYAQLKIKVNNRTGGYM
jgi:hypothetical protein